MMGVAERHYDWKVKEMAKQGGILWGLRNTAIWTEDFRAEDPNAEPSTSTLAFRDADIMMKCMEQASFLYSHLGYSDEAYFHLSLSIHKQLHEILDAIRKRYDEVNEAFKSDNYYARQNKDQG